MQYDWKTQHSEEETNKTNDSISRQKIKSLTANTEQTETSIANWCVETQIIFASDLATRRHERNNRKKIETKTKDEQKT